MADLLDEETTYFVRVNINPQANWNCRSLSYQIRLRGAASSLEKYPAKQHASSVATYLGSRAGLVYLQGGQTATYRDSDQPRPFRQQRYFYYMSGVDEPDCYLTYDLATETLKLYIQPIDPKTVIWNGPTISIEEARERYDIDEVRLSSSLQEDVQSWIRHNASPIFILHPDQAPPVKQDMPPIVGDGHGQIYDVEQLQPAMDKARVLKSPHEIKLIRRANDVTAAAHTAVLRALRRLNSEAQIEANFVDACISRGAKHQAYEVIAAAGAHASTLHYVRNDAPLRGTQLVCLDAGCEWACYASDVTRTFPVRGRWSDEAHNIHRLVQHMQDRCIARIRPGVRLLDLHVMAHKIAITGLLELGLLHAGSVEEIYHAGTSLFFYPHGLSHHLGLECHDVFTDRLLGREQAESCPVLPLRLQGGPVKEPQLLQENMVITVEPGIYFSKFAYKELYQKEPHSKYINHARLERYWAVGGVRIEDDVLVTRDGHENLTTAPKGDDMLQLINAEA